MSTAEESKKEELNDLVRKIKAISDLTSEALALKIGYDSKYLSKFGPKSSKPPGQAVLDKLRQFLADLEREREPKSAQLCTIRWRGAEMTYTPGHEREAALALADLIQLTAAAEISVPMPRPAAPNGNEDRAGEAPSFDQAQAARLERIAKGILSSRASMTGTPKPES